MRKIFKFAMSALLVTTALTAAACGGGKGKSEENKLYIVYYPGGYGTEYLTDFVTRYIAEVRYNGDTSKVVSGKDYELKPDTNAAFNPNYLTSKDRNPDLIIAGQPQSSYIAQGLVEPLNSVFEEKITYTNEEGETVTGPIKDYVIPYSYKQFEREMIFDKCGGQKDIYAMPWSQIPLSFAYNETLLKTIPHVDANGPVASERLKNGNWDNPPETYDELITYFKDVEVGNKNVAPFAWCKANANWFETLYMSWWAETQGLYTSLVEGEKSFYDFWNLESAKLFEQTGIQTALDKVKELLYDKSGNTQHTYNVLQGDKKKDNTIITGTWMQSDFAEGNAAVCLTGDFFAKEYETQIAKSGQTFKMMKVPTISNNLVVDDGKGGTRPMNTVFCNVDSSAFIPSKAKNIDLAKGFLKFTCQEEQILKFVKYTGCLKPFYVNKDKLYAQRDWNSYEKSVLDLYFNSDEVIYKFPKTKMADVSPIFTNEGIRSSFLVGTDYATTLMRLKNYTGKQIMIDGSTNQFKSVKAAAQLLYTQANVGYNTVYASWIATQKDL